MRRCEETQMTLFVFRTPFSMLFPRLPYTGNSLWDPRKFSQQSFITFTLVVLTKSIFLESKQSFPFIISPLPPTMTIPEALKELIHMHPHMPHGTYLFPAQDQIPASSVIIHGQCKELIREGTETPVASTFTD